MKIICIKTPKVLSGLIRLIFGKQVMYPGE
ncbi:MAG: stage V sporulation protein SpoVM [Clostridia bacterium]|nr:stage V sporulation protein SpoVM [Clostridia bacterium]